MDLGPNLAENTRATWTVGVHKRVVREVSSHVLRKMEAFMAGDFSGQPSYIWPSSVLRSQNPGGGGVDTWKYGGKGGRA